MTWIIHSIFKPWPTHQTIMSCRLWWSPDLQVWTSKISAMVETCGDNLRFWSFFHSCSPFWSHSSTSTTSAGFGDHGFKQRQNQEMLTFHHFTKPADRWQESWQVSQGHRAFYPLNIFPASGCVDCVTGLSHYAVWRSCIHKDVRDRGGLATWMNVAGGSKISINHN